MDLILEQIPGAKVSYQEHGADPRNYKVDFRKVRETFGFEPEYTVKNGVIEIITKNE